MNFELSDEQRMLREAAADALSRLDTLASAREALDGAPLLDLWPTAVQAGWTGLLIAEEHGGAGLGVFDAMLVLEECGKRLTGAGLIGHLTATHALTAGGCGDAGLLTALAAGELRAAFAPSAGARFVPDAAGADVLVVGAGEGVAVVGAEQATVEPVRGYDASRPLAHVTVDPAPEATIPGGAAEAWSLGQALLGADALGVCEACLDMSVAYAKERHAFGRPIGSYQAVKHQLVEILRQLDATRNLCYFAGYAAECEPDSLALATSCARFTGEHAADYATRTCIAVHGGIGATWEHDAPLYWRRSQLSRLLLGGVAAAGDRVAEEIIARAREHAAA